MSFRRRVAGLIALSSASLPGSAAADGFDLPGAIGTGERIATDRLTGFVFGGFDPVALALDGELRPGLPAFETVHAGAAFRFASEANRRAFLRDPDAFVPRLGGHDASAMADGRIATGSVFLPLVLAGRILLFRSETGRERVRADPGLVERAEALWPALQRTLAGADDPPRR